MSGFACTIGSNRSYTLLVVLLLQYNKLFCHTAARDHTVTWDVLKEDLLLWCMTCNRHPFWKSSIQSRLGPPSLSTCGSAWPSDWATHTAGGKRRSVENLMPTRAPEATNAYSPTHAGTWLPWQPLSQSMSSPQQTQLLSSSELTLLYDCLNLRKSLSNHPDKDWSSALRKAMEFELDTQAPDTPALHQTFAQLQPTQQQLISNSRKSYTNTDHLPLAICNAQDWAPFPRSTAINGA